MVLAAKHKDKLEKIREDVTQSHQYFRKNIDRYKEFVKFVFDTALSDEDLAALEALQKPNIEFNVLESYVSRLRGEFADNEPGILVSAADGTPSEVLDEKFFKTMKVIEEHIREMFDNSKNDSLQNKIFNDVLAGGYSVVGIYTDYINDMSFEQNIYVERVFDPTLTGFDPMARDSHKGDGRYCFEIIPMTRDDFENEFGAELTKNMTFTKTGGSEFNWSYKAQEQEIVMLVDYYEKIAERKKIVKLSNGAVILKEHYQEMADHINQSGMLRAAPIVVSERWTSLETIHRYRTCGTEVLEHKLTAYKQLPLVFVDGNSMVVYDKGSGVSQQMTRPYVYHAKGIQKLKNFAGQTVGNEIENMSMTTWVTSLDSIPEKYLEAHLNPQHAQTLVYNEFYKSNPDIKLTPPREAQRTPTPPIVIETFMGSDATMQSVLGSFDAQQGHIGANDLSGKAIQMGAMQSNTSAMPYFMGYINGMNRVAQIIIDLIPKFYITPRTLPIKKDNGKRSYVVANDEGQEDAVFLNYDPNSLNISVEVGVNTKMQKQIALETIVTLMGASELFSEFMNTEGLEVLLENIDIRGIEELKERSKQFMEQKRAMQQAAFQAEQEKAGQPSEADKLIMAELAIEKDKIEQKREEAEGKQSIAVADVAIKEQKAYQDFIGMMAKIENDATKNEMTEQKALADTAQNAVKNAIEVAKAKSSADGKHKMADGSMMYDNEMPQG
ncbi:MAG: hypothetical protein DRQ48_00840 [Gammaproteobacteria bacterium]|nr:MAG: hypothetical protein DRQ44_00530 [Gammaproteobacteria bacterium]RKZ72225.1 MAG: hypothetical protein DRQ48_00840 [Gammaproteobacteria bacterium]